MEIGDKVKINCSDSEFHNCQGTIDDFENLKLRDDSSLVLVKVGKYRYEWFFGKELTVVNK